MLTYKHIPTINRILAEDAMINSVETLAKLRDIQFKVDFVSLSFKRFERKSDIMLNRVDHISTDVWLNTTDMSSLKDLHLREINCLMN